MILLIETATSVCSVALAKDGVVTAFKQVNARNIHAEIITVFIDEMMKSTGLSYNQLDAVAVSCGPGSYTGLRIGVSTAKGLCYALDKPLIAVETLEAMAFGVINDKDLPVGEGTLLCPMIDARRMEVFTAVFDSKGRRVKSTAAEIIDENSFAGLLTTNKMLFFGDGADKCLEALGQHSNAAFLTGFTNSATHLTQISAQKFKQKNFEDVAYFEPYYLKDFIAGKKKEA